jgi:hypothetical protein
LDKPFIDSLCWMRHEDSALEIRFGQDVRKGSGMVDMKTWSRSQHYLCEG